jgi:hypothetical protein
MDKRYIAIGIVGIVLLGGYKLYERAGVEYSRFSGMVVASFGRVGEGIDQAIATAKSAEKTSDSMRETLEDLRNRVMRLESNNVEQVSRLSIDAAAESSKSQATIDELIDQLDKETDRREQAELALEQAHQSLKLIRDSPANKALPIGPKIVMHSGPGCLPCQQWKRDVMPLWKSKGWAVEILEETTTDRTWPWFEVFEGGRRYEVVGPLTLESYGRVKR